MERITYNFWNIKNEHIKNAIVFFAVFVIVLLAILTSSLSVVSVNMLRFQIFNPEIENIRETATQLINTSQSWNLINEIIRGLLMILFIKLISKFINKTKIHLSELGVSFDKKQPGYLILGVIIMSFMFSGALLIDVGISGFRNIMGLVFSSNELFMAVLVALANAFWQEVAFRGFLQKRLINTYGILPGILICSFLFAIIHGLVREITLSELVLGTVLFTFVGLLYYLTNSIWISTAIHATGNFFLRTLDTNNLHIPDQLSRLIIYGFFLIVLILVFRKKIFAIRKINL